VRSKYRAIRTEVDGKVFASKKEAKRYAELKLLLKAGAIRELFLQPKFPVTVNDIQVFTYVADFQYMEADGALVVEDVKGVKTPMYRLKKKCVEAQYGIEIREV
jgi:hypothetical protein